MISSRLCLLIAFVVLSSFSHLNCDSSTSSRSAAPIFELEDEAKGFYGTIGERNVLVDLKPHLQIKNIDAINGICSYHVFKPNTEEFPFTIDIKDKLTGEAVIELVKDLDANSTNSEEDLKQSSPLDCSKRKEYHFLLQAYDCSNPAHVSIKVPVKIEVIDHDDYKPQFEMRQYTKKMVKTDEIVENFMTVKARDNDCTNNGYACSYEIVRDQLVPFRIDSTGSISTTGGLDKTGIYTFKVRGFDCLSKSSYAEADVTIEVSEPCSPKFIDYQNEVLTSTSQIDNVFGLIKTTSCDDENTKQYCQIDSVNSKVSLILDPSVKNTCAKETCGQTSSFESPISYTRDVLFSSSSSSSASSNTNGNADDDDSLEDSSSTEDDANKNNNKVVPNKDLTKPSDFDQKEPMNYRSFSKSVENAQKISFDGQFGSEFALSAWIRRPANADKSIKEQVLCGTDSNLMNRHHFGLYFYQGNIKFLMRHEPNKQATEKKNKEKKPDGIVGGDDFDTTRDEFFPSLWEWSLSEAILTDSKWHFYEVRVNYPNASLFIDGVRFVENVNNSDIIDAYELNSVSGIGPIITYVGACYHARTQSLVDHFEGDVSSLVLTRKSNIQKATNAAEQKQKSLIECSKNCREYIEVNMVGNENFINSIQNTNQNEINIQTTNLNDMEQLIRKVNYINKQPNVQQSAPRSIKLQSKIHCANSGKSIDLNEIEVKIGLRGQKQEYKVELDGDKTVEVDKNEVSKGFEPFRHMSIMKTSINKVDSDASSSEDSSNEDTNNNNNNTGDDAKNDEENDDDGDDDIKLSMCQIRMIPERNLMAPFENNERLMFLQSLMDQFQFKFEETADLVTISGVESVENYETFMRSLTYRIFNLKDTDDLSLINKKEFDISCWRSEPNIETNTIRIYLDLKEKLTKSMSVNGVISNKQAQKLVVNSDNEEEILTAKKSSDSKYSPMTIAFIVMVCCCLSFMLVFGAIKAYSSGFLSRRRKLIVNEENPQMEWDDSGLNITENPLDALPKKCEYHDNTECRLDYEDEYSSSSDSSDEGEADERYEDDEEPYSSDEEPNKNNNNEVKILDRELEWDDSSLEIKARDQQLELERQKSLHQQQLKNFI